jgi:hypothetical protein
MKYRVIDDDEELIVLVEDGSIATVRCADEMDGDGRRSTVEWYDQSFLDMKPELLQQVTACPIEDLPKYLNIQDELVQEVLKERLNSGEAAEYITYYIWDWLGNNSNIYYHDSKLDFKDASHIDKCLEELIGTPAADNERDDTLFRKYFDFD